jgi:phosphomethylpyrimidine synthase
MTIHAGILTSTSSSSSGAASPARFAGRPIIAKWMVTHRRQNPSTHYDQLLEIRRNTTSAVARRLAPPGRPPRCVDKAQFAELDTLGEPTRRAWERDVQVMVEGPGHVPMD